MGFQGSIVVTREVSKEYIVLSTNQSKKLLSGGQMSCNKDAATFWTSADNIVKESVTSEQSHLPEIVFGKDMNEWIKEFVQNQFFHVNNNVVENKNVAEKPETTDDANFEVEKVKNNDDTKVADEEEDSVIDVHNNEYIDKNEEIDSSKLSANDDSKSGKVKKNFKVFKFMKNAIKKHIKK